MVPLLCPSFTNKSAFLLADNRQSLQKPPKWSESQICDSTGEQNQTRSEAGTSEPPELSGPGWIWPLKVQQSLVHHGINHPAQLDFPNLGIHKISLSWRSVEQIQILHLVGSISLTCSAPVPHRGRWSSFFLICRQKSQTTLAFKGNTELMSCGSGQRLQTRLFNAAQILCSWFFGSSQLQTRPVWSSAPSWVLCSSSSSCWPSWQFSSGSWGAGIGRRRSFPTKSGRRPCPYLEGLWKRRRMKWI